MDVGGTVCDHNPGIVPDGVRRLFHRPTIKLTPKSNAIDLTTPGRLIFKG